MVLWAFFLGGWACCDGCGFLATGCQGMGARGTRTDRMRQRDGAGTNVHFEKSHNEHTVASVAAPSSTQQLNASLYLALKLCRLSIAPLRQSPVTLNNGTLTFLARCSELLCDYCAHPFICHHISLDEVLIKAPVMFPFSVRLQTAETFSKDWKYCKSSHLLKLSV